MYTWDDNDCFMKGPVGDWHFFGGPALVVLYLQPVPIVLLNILFAITHTFAKNWQSCAMVINHTTAQNVHNWQKTTWCWPFDLSVRLPAVRRTRLKLKLMWRWLPCRHGAWVHMCSSESTWCVNMIKSHNNRLTRKKEWKWEKENWKRKRKEQKEIQEMCSEGPSKQQKHRWRQEWKSTPREDHCYACTVHTVRAWVAYTIQVNLGQMLV